MIRKEEQVLVVFTVVPVAENILKTPSLDSLNQPRPAVRILASLPAPPQPPATDPRPLHLGYSNPFLILRAFAAKESPCFKGSFVSLGSGRPGKWVGGRLPELVFIPSGIGGFPFIGGILSLGIFFAILFRSSF